MILPRKATQPTLYFIGVTTSRSSIMKLFPLWAEALGLVDAVIEGIDIEIHADPQVYRDVVEFIKHDKLSMGALVTTHKIDIFKSTHDLFDYLDPYATSFCELSCISKKDGKLEGYAKDPISSGLAIESFIPERFWTAHGGEVFIMGAGGSAIAITSYLLKKTHGENVPTRIYVSDLNQHRLDSMKTIIEQLSPESNVEYMLVAEPVENDKILAKMKPYSLVINATGLGKDRPGSPLTNDCQFPRNSLVWELNYRGNLLFMKQAMQQKEEKALHIEDGWVYFIHGWTQVIAEVFHIEIGPKEFAELKRIANQLRTH